MNNQKAKEAVQEFMNANPEASYEDFLNVFFAPFLEETLKTTKGNQTKAAIRLGINRMTLRKYAYKYIYI